ncbi:MAG: hypothetical protein U5O39_03580 [Gammaproteobacteria bacterium]|nr:hypothetical protein [Gammaproteobacteria bacterium]
MNQRTLTIVGLVVLTGLVFHPILFHDFINFDTPSYIHENPNVRTGLTLDRNIVWALTAFHISNWHPLTWISHMIDVTIFGLNPAGHLGVNLLLHVLNTCLLYTFFTLTTRDHWAAAFIAVLFAIHPMHVESVAWVAERKDVLSTAFFLTTILLWRAWTLRPQWHRYLLVCTAFVLGVLSKPMVVTLPFVLLLLDYWPLGRFDGHDRLPQWIMRLLVLTREKIPLLAITAGSVAITFIAQRSGGAMEAGTVTELHGQRFSNALTAYIIYLGKALVPSELALFYPHPASRPLLAVAAAFGVLLAISLLAIVYVRRVPWFFVGWSIFLGTLVPVIGIVQVGGQAYADRYTYIPYIGLFMALVFGGRALFRRIDVNPAILRRRCHRSNRSLCAVRLPVRGPLPKQHLDLATHSAGN